jgi:Na+/H+ antiporter NhaD/arsenite permease-like protein
MFVLASSIAPSPLAVLPFVALLLSIALLPLFAAHWWERHYAKLAVGLGLIVGGYYAFALGQPAALLHVAEEYVSFISLIGALFVISGGINLRIKGEATPLRNVLFLACGAILANLVGTTGASMLLVRAWIRSNKYRITGLHIVFFIFIVSNCAGCLTPIGDPPLFIGYLRGVPFTWTLGQAWPAWLMANGLLLITFYILDKINFMRAPQSVREMETAHETLSLRGTHNLIFLAIVLGAVFLPSDLKLGPITVSALVMAIAAAGSYFSTSRDLHEANDFSWHPVLEVGFLFIGIFLTMMPALDLLKGGAIAISSPLQAYFFTGSLSAVLDNAPTYLAFLAAEMGTRHLDVGSTADVMTFAQTHVRELLAVSLGAVFFGAGTYIGNAPNFMVKSIAERAGVKAPSFIAYVLYFSLPILLPILAITGWWHLRG